MSTSSGSIAKLGSGALALFAGLLLIAVIAASAVFGGGVSWWGAAPLGLAAYVALKSKKPAAQPTPVSAANIEIGEVLKGVNTTVEVRRDGIAINRTGAVGLLAYGMKGEKLLPFRSITSVQFKEPGRSMAGYIQFGVKGGIESARGIIEASGDENSVLFDSANHAKFLALYRHVEERVSETAPATNASMSAAEQLATLSSLYDAGRLSEAEFTTQKQRIMSN